MKHLTPGATWLEDSATELAVFVLLSTAPWTFLVSTRVGQLEVWRPWMPTKSSAEEHVRHLFEHAKKIG